MESDMNTDPDFLKWSLEEKRELLKKILHENKTASQSSIDFKTTEFKRVEAFLKYCSSKGIKNPYFRCVEGVSRDVISIAGKEYINFSGYNYVGCSGDPYVNHSVFKAIEQFGTSVSASRVASGNKTIHLQLEEMLAKNLDCEAALCFVGGYTTNVSTIGHLMTSEDLILQDSLAHRSLIAGAIVSGARRVSFKHNDIEDLELKCKEFRHQYKKCIIVIEGVYSMDGDIPDLPSYIALKNKYDCMLMIDEAHSAGVLGQTGKGIRELFGVHGHDVDIWMGTLSKSYASCGGYIAGTQNLIKNLKYTCPGFVYSVGLSPPATAAAIASLELIDREPDRLIQLHAMANLFRDESKKYGLDIGLSHGSGVVPIITGKSSYALYLSDRLFKQGINAQPIFYPAVEENLARVRFFISSLHSESQIKTTVNVIARTLKEIQDDSGLIADFPVD